MGEEKSGKQHLRESRKHLEKGTQKFLKQGGEKLEYYRQNRSRLIEGFSRKFGHQKKPAAAGLIILAPLFVVALVVGWLFEKIAAIPGNQYFNIGSYIGLSDLAAFYVNQSFKLAILLIGAAVLVTAVGRLGRTDIGFKMERMLDRLFDRIPFLGAIYSITKVTTETLMGGAEDLSEPVKLEINGMKVTAFKTGNTAPDGRHVLFVPTSPNITTGFVTEVTEDRIIENDETAEQALTRILSAGFGEAKTKTEE